MLLLDERSKIDLEEKKFQAAMHGVDLGKDRPSNRNSPQFSTVQESSPMPLFGNPQDYEKMTPETRQAMTDKMLGTHKQWAGQNPLKAGG